MEADKEAIRKKLGNDLFEGIYEFLVHHRSQSQTNEAELFMELKQWIGGDKRLMHEVLKLDGIVYN